MIGRHSRRWLAAAFLATASLTALAGPAAAQSAPAIQAPPLSFTTRTLPNGLTVYALRDTRTSNVAVQLWYQVGSRDDPSGRSGFAHLFEHILSRVTINLTAGQISRIVEEEAGGTRNASTRPDSTAYYETVPANRLEAMIWTHAERMGRSVLDQAIFDAERNIVQEEMRQNVLSPPYGRLQRYFLFDNVFTTSPYRRSGIGTQADLRAATLDDARAFHENFYRPDNATLVVSGNFDPAELDRYIDRHLAPLPRPSRPILRFEGADRPRTEPQVLTAYGPNVPLPAIMLAWQRPRLNHPDSAALEVLSRILSGGQSSRLYQSLVYRRALAQSANAINFGLHDTGLFAMQAVVASGQQPAEAETALAAEVTRIRDEAVSAAELAEAKTEFVSDTLFARETPTGRANEVGEMVTTAGDPRWQDRMLAAVQQVTAADVQRVARQYLTDNSRLTIRYLDQSQRQGEAAGDPPMLPTDPALGRTLPAAVGTPNQLAPEGQRMAVPAATPARPFPAPTFAEQRLANGMRVIVARSSDLPLASATLVFGGGTATDPANRAGTANMMTTVVDSGAGDFTAPQIAARIESLGGQIGASAGPDNTTAFVAAPIANITAAGELLREIVQRPTFAEAELERERRRALDGLRVAMRQPVFVNNLATRRALYGDAPYGAPVNGTPASLAALTRADIVDYHRTWWRPDNATLVITGAMDADTGFALAERLFGSWAAPGGAMPALPAARAGAAAAPRVVVIDMPEADQAAVSVALRGVTRADSDYYPLLVANNVLGGSSTARLFQEVRVRRALSYGAYSNLTASLDEGALIAQAQTRNDAAVEVANVMLGEVRRLAAERVPDDVLTKRQTLLTGAFGRQVETMNGLGTFLANLAIQGVPMSEFSRYAANLDAVTPDAIARSVAAELDPAQASIVIVGKASDFMEALRAQYPNAEVIPMSALDLGRGSMRAAAAP